MQMKQWEEEKHRLTGAVTRANTTIGLGQIADNMACDSERLQVHCFSRDGVWHLQCSVGADPYIKPFTTANGHT